MPIGTLRDRGRVRGIVFLRTGYGGWLLVIDELLDDALREEAFSERLRMHRVLLAGIEPTLQASEARVLSVERQEVRAIV